LLNSSPLLRIKNSPLTITLLSSFPIPLPTCLHLKDEGELSVGDSDRQIDILQEMIQVALYVDLWQ